jgi:hypothetical protein
MLHNFTCIDCALYMFSYCMCEWPVCTADLGGWVYRTHTVRMCSVWLCILRKCRSVCIQKSSSTHQCTWLHVWGLASRHRQAHRAQLQNHTQNTWTKDMYTHVTITCRFTAEGHQITHEFSPVLYTRSAWSCTQQDSITSQYTLHWLLYNNWN